MTGPQCRPNVFIRRIEPRPLHALFDGQLLDSPPQKVLILSPVTFDVTTLGDLTAIAQVKQAACIMRQ
jgi:hypothetical protein